MALILQTRRRAFPSTENAPTITKPHLKRHPIARRSRFSVIRCTRASGPCGRE